MAVITGPLDAGRVSMALPSQIAQTGYAVLAGEAHNSTSGGAATIRRPTNVTPDGRLRTGVDQVLWNDSFAHGVLDLNAYSVVTATATVAQAANGFLVLNSGNSTVSAQGARIQTYRTFSFSSAAALEVTFRARFSITPTANNIAEMGLGFVPGASGGTPSDGVYFKLTSSGDLVGVVNVNGAEVGVTAAMPSPIPNNVASYRIVIDQDRAEFFINDICRGVLLVALTAPSVTQLRQLPLFARLYNIGTTSSAQRLEIADVVLVAQDVVANRPFSTQMVGMETGAYHQIKGVSSGQSANYVNNTGPVSATLSNTVAGYTTLGGQFQFATVAGSEVDYAIFAFSSPSLSTTVGNRNLIITGVRIDSLNTGTAVATTATVLQWALGVGATADSLATTDSGTAGTRAPRRIPLGIQSFPIGAAVGAQATLIDVKLDAPCIIPPGGRAHIILKTPIGTATATQVIRGLVYINGYYE